jgi:hypothetical protein
MTVFRTRQRAEEFAALVDGATAPLREVRAGHDSEVDRLVGIVQTMRREAADERVLPREAFTLDLRERLMTEAETVLIPRKATLSLPPRTRGKRERRLVAVASAAVLIGGTAGMAAAAQHSLPGEALYPIKRGIESAQVDLATSPAGQGRHLLTQAGDRLDEVQGLMAAGPATGSPQIPGTLDEFTAQSRKGADLLMASYADTSDPKTIAAVRDFTAHDNAILQGLAQTAPTAAQPALRNAVIALAAIDSQASQACPSCSDLPVLKVSKKFLVANDVDRAMHALGSSHLNNDHPVIAPRDAVERADSDVPGSTASKAPSASVPSGAPSSGPSSGATSGAGSGTGSGSAIGGLVKSPPTLKIHLPGGKSGSGGSGTKSGSNGGSSSLGAGLGSAVETLLPDVDVPGLPKLH